MPCFATGSAEGDARLAAEERHAQVTKLTALLCKTLRTLPQADIDVLPMDVQEWWAEHQRIDAAREAREAAYKAKTLAEKTKQYKKLKKELGL